jgi:hypothetical protein
LQPLAQTFEAIRSPAHGHVQAVALTLQRLGLAGLVSSKPCRERALVLAMVASRILSLPGVNYPELLATTIVSGAVGR